MQIISHDFIVVEGQTITIAPISDIQWNGRDVDIADRLLEQHLDRCSQKEAYYVGLGDYIDFLSPSGRTKVQKIGLYDNANHAIADKATTLVEEVTNLLECTRGQWLGMVYGHHYSDIQGVCSDQILAEKLEAPFLGACGMIRLRCHLYKTKHVTDFWLWLHHGNGNGGPGHALRRLNTLRASWPQVDVFLIGHMTKIETAKVAGVEYRENPERLYHKPISLVCTGGWSKGYKLKGQDYVEDQMLVPAALGAPLIHLYPRFDQKEGLVIHHTVEI